MKEPSSHAYCDPRQVDRRLLRFVALVAFTTCSELAGKISSLASSRTVKNELGKASTRSFDANDWVHRNVPAMVSGL